MLFSGMMFEERKYHGGTRVKNVDAPFVSGEILRGYTRLFYQRSSHFSHSVIRMIWLWIKTVVYLVNLKIAGK